MQRIYETEYTLRRFKDLFKTNIFFFWSLANISLWVLLHLQFTIISDGHKINNTIVELVFQLYLNRILSLLILEICTGRSSLIILYTTFTLVCSIIENFHCYLIQMEQCLVFWCGEMQTFNFCFHFKGMKNYWYQKRTFYNV